MINVSWQDAQSLIAEGDILLFRAKPSIFSISWWIAKYGFGDYSHVSLASIMPDGQIGCLEFREFIGSRYHPLIEELNSGHYIDVYRISRSISYTQFNQETGLIEQRIKEFNTEIAKRITDTAKDHVTRKEGYAWAIIWKIAVIFIPLYRLFINKNPIIEEDSKHFVCSTFVAYSYRKNFIDLVPGISDVYTQPSDISRSAYINYLFTIKADKK